MTLAQQNCSPCVDSYQNCNDLSADKVDALINDAQDRLSVNQSLHPYTSFLNEHLDEEARFQVICALWQLALADDRIDKLEEHTIRRASDLLYLSHSRFIEAKFEPRPCSLRAAFWATAA